MIFIENLVRYKCIIDGNMEQNDKMHNGDVLEKCTVGDVITFGTYAEKIYEDNTKHIKETRLASYEWEVVKSEGSKRLLLLKSGSINGISDGTDSLIAGDSSWERTYMREWLNDIFFNYAFSNKEKELIMDSKLKNNKGKDTIDKVFVPSIEEVKKIFDNEELFHEKMGNRYFRDSSESGKGVKVYYSQEKKIIDFEYNLYQCEPNIAMWIDVSK